MSECLNSAMESAVSRCPHSANLFRPTPPELRECHQGALRMNMPESKFLANELSIRRKFDDPMVTADGSERAYVPLLTPRTLWFNTGTLCNIECRNCYIESSPKNDSLVYISATEVGDYLMQIKACGWPISEIGLTGGEPFMNFEIIEIIRLSLEQGYAVLVLTNAMRPLMRPRVQTGLLTLLKEHGDKLTLRISLDHFTEELHDSERGKGAFRSTLAGMDWLSNNGFRISVAGRTVWGETEEEARAGYAHLFKSRNYCIDSSDPEMTVLFPEIDQTQDVPEISVDCWKLLNKLPSDVMCSSSRMVVKRRGDATPRVVACTLLPHDRDFELGSSLKESEQSVRLNHPCCAQFCVLGGASCSRG